MAVASVTKASGDTVGASERNALREDILRHAGDTLTDTGAADAYIVTCDNQVTSLSVGQIAKFIPSADNTGPATLRFKNSLALDDTSSILQTDGTPLIGGEISALGLCLVEFNGTDWILLSPVQLQERLDRKQIVDEPISVLYTHRDLAASSANGGNITVYGTKALLTASSTSDVASLTIPAPSGSSFFNPAADIDSSKFGLLGAFRRITSQYADLFFGLHSVILSSGILSSAVDTTAHIGFYASGTTMYASVGSGSAQTRVDVSAFIPDQTAYSTFEIKYLSPTSVKFYIDGVEAAHITTNIPSAVQTLRYVGIGIDNNSSSSSRNLEVKPVILFSAQL